MLKSTENDQREGQEEDTCQTKEIQQSERELERKNQKKKIQEQAQWEKEV